MIKRIAEQQLVEAMADTPVVIVQGPRQCGKTTLVRHCAPHLPYITLDDSLSLEAALKNPRGLLRAHPAGAVIDEVQRAPDLMRSIKAEVDADRRPGRYVLTGSTNLLRLPRLTESLAGRMEVISLWPFAQCEIRDRPPLLPALLEDPTRPPAGPFPPFSLEALSSGGFPEPVARAAAARRRAWFDGYIKALVERDIRSLADVEGLASLPRLLKLLAASAGETVNAASLSRLSGIPHTTLQRYLALFEAVFLTAPLPAWQSSSGHRVIKAPRTTFVDSGILLHLLGIDLPRLSPYDPLVGRVLAGWAAMELQRMGEGLGCRLLHFRSIRRCEVPIVVELPDGRILAFDVCAEQAPSAESFAALEFLKAVAGDRFAAGWVLYMGEACQPYTQALAAMPISALS